MQGSEHNDQMDRNGFLTNHSGGILGGLSTGSDIVFRVVVKPTSSISVPQRTVNNDGEERQIAMLQ
jgi:chorismate synthase